MTEEKLTLWPPLDNSVEGGYKAFRVHVPEFDEAFAWHDSVYIKIWEGVLVITLEDADRHFLRQMETLADAQEEPWKREKLRRYAWEFYYLARLWATTFRPTFEAWKPGDGPLKEKYAN